MMGRIPGPVNATAARVHLPGMPGSTHPLVAHHVGRDGSLLVQDRRLGGAADHSPAALQRL